MASSMISEVVEPTQPNTRYAWNVTPGATPLMPPFAPMMPATCVPWPSQSSGSVGHRHGLMIGVDVVGVERVADQIEALCHAAAGPEAAAEIRMVVVDAGVDDGDLDAAAGEPQLALRDVGAGLLQRGDQIGDVARLLLPAGRRS